MLCIYIPIIREELKTFVHVWNRHRIRPQPNKLYSIPGKPWMLFHHPGEGIRNFKQPFSQQKLSEFRKLYKWNKDAYLPSKTLKWCHGALEEDGYQLPLDSKQLNYTGQAVHSLAYIDLRASLIAHIHHGNLEGLGLLPKPKGAYNWEPASQEVAVGLDQAFEGDTDEEGIDFANEGRDDYLQADDSFYPLTDEEEEEVSTGHNRGDRRAFVSGGTASPVESDAEDDLLSNVRRRWCIRRAAARKVPCRT
jgi:hypothetical protein